MSSERRITIIGGGLAGPLLACLLADDGHDVAVLEQRGDPRAAGYEGGRSINLALSARGIEALDRIELKQQVLDEAVPMRGRMMHDRDGNRAFSPYSIIPGEAINSVSRGGLNCTLLDAAESRPNVQLHFGVECSIDVEQASVTWTNADGTSVSRSADLVVGADGAGSAVREAMCSHGSIKARTDFIDSGYKELSIPPGPGGSFQLENDALHIWPRGRYMMIALPNADGSFTCTCFWPLEGEASFEEVSTADSVMDFFQVHFPDAVPLMPDLVDEYQANPVGPLGTVRCSSYHHDDTAVLVGDAAHAIVPFFGQGMNAAFQDCLRLADSLREHADLGEALVHYDRTQRPDGEAIAEFSLENFIEMQDKTASRLFRFKQRIRKRLNRMFPKFYVPRYNLVSFTTIPYSKIQKHLIVRQLALVGVLLVLVVVVKLIILRIRGTI